MSRRRGKRHPKVGLRGGISAARRPARQCRLAASGHGGAARGLAAMSCYAAALRVSGESGREVEAAEGVWGEEGGDLLDLRAAQSEHVDGV